GPDPRNFNQRVSLGRNDLLIRTFPKPQLERRDIVIEELNVQIGYSGTLVPFRINGVDDRRFFGMSGCASLDSVEYATEFLTQH
ncbi:hypothetical protein NXG20_29650, partial [Klebsiella pneumoniae]|nr:hypothetical protein [Klebsiella pneumoniae]MDS6993874.1 hypothetical protein [Klebsiella pneumoniae]MDS7011093.1 hypothetical protein [Klebsiella pneumoniae]MDS7050151.1 hypothetical protein [Klebsiella pneumoniae]MDS7149120.1 hypothetical protein [Klebsiella pneumoniae]